MDRPAPEIDVTAELVRDLLLEQHPDLAGLPLRYAHSGWDNATWRLGDLLAVRLPVRAVAAPLIEHEQEVLPALADLLPVPIPVPVRAGTPSARFPWRWSVVPWFDGVCAGQTDVASRTAWAGDLARTLVALHVPAPLDAPYNPYRGVPLASRDAVIRGRVLALERPERERLLAAWEDGLAASVWHGPALWLHGDPHPANLLVRDHELAALLDFGDVTAGDPATDLSTAWLTFDAAGRARFCAVIDAGPYADESMWRRARAWAVPLTLALLAHPQDHPLLATIGEQALQELAHEPGLPG